MDVKIEAMRLRREDRLSISEISEQTGISRGTLSQMLQNDPLTSEEISQRHMGCVSSRKAVRGHRSKYADLMETGIMTRQRKARISEAAVLFRLALHGFAIYGRIFDGEKTDWLVDLGDKKVAHIQVKTVKIGSHGRPQISLTCVEGHNQRRRYRSNELDFICGYDLYTDIVYVFTEEEALKNKAYISIVDDAAERWDKLKIFQSST